MGVVNVWKVVGDGAYGSKVNFYLASGMDVLPLIRVRKDASLKVGGCLSYNFVVIGQFGRLCVAT